MIEILRKTGIVPVVVLNDSKNAEALAEALCKGGLPCAEVTFRTSAAGDSIRIMAEKYPQMLIGAGTVLTKEQADCRLSKLSGQFSGMLCLCPQEALTQPTSGNT